MAYGSNSVATLNLDGGTLTAQNIEERQCRGLRRPELRWRRVAARGGEHDLQALTAANVGAGGATFDLSQVSSYTLAQTLTHDASVGGTDGGLTKTGSGKLVVSAAQRYDGPTLVSEGSLGLPSSGSLSNATSLTVSPGASLILDASAVQTVSLSGLTLGGASPAYLTLAFASDGSSNDHFVVDGPVTLVRWC
jgi:autotransporter-associated beta strand protein